MSGCESRSKLARIQIPAASEIPKFACQRKGEIEASGNNERSEPEYLSEIGVRCNWKVDLCNLRATRIPRPHQVRHQASQMTLLSISNHLLSPACARKQRLS